MENTLKKEKLGNLIALLKNNETNIGKLPVEIKNSAEKLRGELKTILKKANHEITIYDPLKNDQFEKWVLILFFQDGFDFESEIKKMNSNYLLFEKFSQVFVDYLFKCQELNKKDD